MPDILYDFTYTGSTFEPQADPNRLERWWQRDLPKPGAYRPFCVKVTGRQKVNGVEQLTFQLVKEAAQTGAPREFTVKLPIEPDIVWPDLPSTAQLAEPTTRPYGFLFLSDDWAMANNAKAFAEGGGKWPNSAIDADFARVVEAFQDEGTRVKLLQTLDTLKPAPKP